MDSFRRHETLVAFGTQLLPAVRLLAPCIAGLIRAKPRGFLVATALGAAVWNTAFMSVGYAAAALATSPLNMSALALTTLAILVLFQGVAVATWRLFAARRGGAQPA